MSLNVLVADPLCITAVLILHVAKPGDLHHPRFEKSANHELEIVRDMKLMGAKKVSDLTRESLRRR